MFMPKIKPEHRLEFICRRCYYRRNLTFDGYYKGNSKADSYCAYLLIEGEKRGCIPSEGECARFKPRMKFDTTYGRHETIK